MRSAVAARGAGARAAKAKDRIFRALADKRRRTIFESLARGEASVQELTQRFDISQPAVSQHLAALSEAGLVVVRREGRCAYYRAQPRGIRPLVDWIARTSASWTVRAGRLGKLLEPMDG